MALPKISTMLPKLAIAGAIILVLAICAGALYYVAYNKGANKADIEISEYERKVAELNSKLVERQSEVTNNVVKEYHTRTIERERVVYQNASTIVQAVPEQNKLSEGWVYAHNQVVDQELIDPTLASNAAPSNTSDKQALEIIAINYDIAQDTSDKLVALQDWVRQQERVSEETTVN